MKVMAIGVLTALASIAGCATSFLNPDADSIRVTKAKPDTECQYLGDVTAHQGDDARRGLISSAKLTSNAKNDLKNEAGVLGGNVVVLIADTDSYPDNRQSGDRLTADVYFCL